jgi:PHD/YefM family antitoxin component YafN of YafNO toxin-antitoxin module
MKTLELRKASKPLADYAAKLGEEPIVITLNNKPVAALVSLKGSDRESLSLSLNPTFMQIIRRARAEVRRGEVYSLEQVKKELLPKTAAPDKALHLPRREKARRRTPVR